MKSVSSKSGVFVKISRYAGIGVLSIMVLLILSHLTWKFSGSNQWKLVKDESGVKVYTLKSPGSTLLKVKSTGRIRSKLSKIVAYMQDPGGCDDIGCYNSKMIEKVDSRLQYYTFRADFPFPFRTREYVIKALFYQNPITKSVLYEVSSAPDKLAPDNCCFRVTDQYNTWQFTPVGNGEIETQLVMDMDLGGAVPYFLMNLMYPELAFQIQFVLEDFVNREKYQDARYDFIEEPQPDRL